MADRQQRPSREKRKPKKDKSKTPSAQASPFGVLQGADQKKTGAAKKR